MNQALEMISALERQFADRAWRRGIVEAEDYHLAWRFDARRCGDKVLESVLIIEGIEIAEECRGTGVVTEFITRILQGDPAPRIPLKVLYFKECGPGLSRLLERHHFHKHPVGPSQDYWHAVTGQKELPL